MSKQENRKKANQPSNVIALPKRCPAEGCGEKVVRSAFCEEHFDWFKFGLINRKGEKPKDFDKKYQTYLHKFKKKSA